MTVDDIIERMRNGEPLRWAMKSETGRLRDGCLNMRELWIGRELIHNATLAFDVTTDPRVRELPGNEHNDQPYVE